MEKQNDPKIVAPSWLDSDSAKRRRRFSWAVAIIVALGWGSVELYKENDTFRSWVDASIELLSKSITDK